MKKIISKFLKIILPNDIYLNRRDNYLFILYSKIEFFLKTFSLRIRNFKFLFIPSKHIGSIFLLEKLSIFFKKEKIDFFLWDACLLGALRNQNAIAGSALDIDIGIIFDRKKHLNKIKSLKNEFKLKFHNNFNSVQLFHSWGTVDISLFTKKKNTIFITEDVALGKETNTHNPKNYIKKKKIFKFKDFIPFKKAKIYSKKFNIPKNSILLLKKKYGRSWKIPNKKGQLYFT